MIAAHVYVGPDARVRLYSPVVGEWLLVDWAWLLASLSADRQWIIHHDPTFAYAAVASL